MNFSFFSGARYKDGLISTATRTFKAEVFIKYKLKNRTGYIIWQPWEMKM